MPKHVETLVTNIEGICDGKELVAIIAALSEVAEHILEHLPSDELRNQMILRLINTLVFISTADNLETAELERVLGGISKIPDQDTRNVAILGHIKALILSRTEGIAGRKHLPILFAQYNFRAKKYGDRLVSSRGHPTAQQPVSARDTD